MVIIQPTVEGSLFGVMRNENDLELAAMAALSSECTDNPGLYTLKGELFGGRLVSQ